MNKKSKTVRIDENLYNILKDISEKEMISLTKLIDALIKGKIKLVGNDIVREG